MTIRHSVIMIGLFCCLVSTGYAQVAERLGISVGGSYVQPMGALSDRFDGTADGRVGIYYRWTDRIRIEWTVGYHVFNKDWSFTEIAVEGQPAPSPQSLQQEFRIMNIMWNWQVLLHPTAEQTPFFIGGVGLYYTDYTRGKYDYQDIPWDDIRLFDWVMGGNVGIGYLMAPANNFQIYVQGVYNLALTEIWPTLAIGMEKVNPIQTFSFGAGIRYLF